MKNTTLLCGLIWLLVLVATVAGIFYQTPGSPIAYTTVRGEQVVFQGSGLYRYDPAWYVREGVIWDAINLFIGLPLLAAALVLNERGLLRGRLLLGGMLFYFCYVYAMAMTGNSLNPMFLVYVAIFALSGVAFFINLSGIDVKHLPMQVSERFPRRLFIGFTFLVAVVLTFLWVGRIIPIVVNDRFPPELAGVSTLVGQAFDLGMVVPLMLATGVLLWRRSAWGYLLASISITHGLMMCITLPAWIVVPLVQDGKTTLVEAIPFSVLSLAGLYLAARFYRNVQDGPVIDKGLVPKPRIID